MTRISSIIVASALALAAASPALAAWGRSQVVDPAFSRSYDRQLILNANTAAAQPVVDTTSAIGTNDPVATGEKSYFGPSVDRFVESQNSPYDN